MTRPAAPSSGEGAATLDRMLTVLRRAGSLVVPLVAGALVVATVTGPLRPTRGVDAYALLSPALVMADVAAGLALVGAGVTAWLFRRRLVGLLAMLAGLGWFGADWAASPSVDPIIRAGAMAATMLVLPLVVALVVASERVRPGRALTILVVLLVVGAGLVAVAWMRWYEGRFDPRCLELCSMAPIAPDPDRELARRLRIVLLVLQVVAGMALAGWAAVRWSRASGTGRRATGPILMPGAAVGLTWAAWAIASLLPSTVTPVREAVMVSLFVARAVSLFALGVGLASIIQRAWRTVREVRAIAWRISPLPGGGSLRAALATAIGDPGLELRFPLPGTGELVDPDGRAVDHREPGTRISIQHGGETVALAVTTAVAVDGVSTDLGEAVRLAAANEQLLAAVRHEVVALRASRARIVQTGDETRHRLERDLHDGAQQRMLVVLHGLVRARDEARMAGDARAAERLDRAVEDVDAAIDALRRIARGIHPTLLTEAGLVAALDQLAIEAPIPVVADLPPVVACSPATAAIAWRVVADAVGQADRLGADELRLQVEADDVRVRLTITVDGATGPLDLVPLEDRAGAGGGRVMGAAQDGAQSFIVELPCA